MSKVKFTFILSILMASIISVDGAVGLIHSEQMPVDNRYDANLHPKMVRMMSDFKAVVSPIVDEKIGVCHLVHAPEQGNVLHHFLEGCLLKEAGAYSALPIHGALINKGGIRADMKNGDLFVRDVFNLLPFENEMVVVELKGNLLLKIVKQVRLYSSLSKMNIQTIDPNAIYRLVTLDYLTEGNGGMTLLKEAERVIPLRMKARDACIRQIKALTTENHSIDIFSPDAILDKP